MEELYAEMTKEELIDEIKSLTEDRAELMKMVLQRGETIERLQNAMKSVYGYHAE